MKLSDAKSIVRTCVDLKMSVMLHGPVGVGKSSLINELAAETKREVVDVRLSQMDPTDIKGFPAPDLAAKQMHWLPPNFLPPMTIGAKKTPNKTKGIIFLDEANSAPPAVQAACYQLALDRKVGDYTLPADWSVVLAGNRDTDRSLVNRMPAALCNRMLHIDIDVDLDDYVQWGMTKGNLAASSIAFARFRENLLYKFDPNSKDKAFPTPRTWAMVDKIIQSGTLKGPLLREAIAGLVGGGAAAERVAFEEMAAELPSIDDIMLDPEKAPVPEQAGAQYAVTSMLSMAANSVSQWRGMLPYVKRLPVEFNIVFMKDMVAKKDKVNFTTTPEYQKWCLEHQDVIR